MLRRDLATVLGARATWVAASAGALLIGHGFVLAVDLYSAASRSVEAHTLLASEFDPLLGIFRPTLGGLTLTLSLFGPLIGARALAIEKDRRTFHTEVLRVGAAWRFVGRRWIAALVAVALPWCATGLLVMLWRIVGGHHVVERADCFGVGIRVVGLHHRATPQHVVDEDQAVGPHQAEQLLVVAGVALLVGVDEREVEAVVVENRAQRVDRGRNP